MTKFFHSYKILFILLALLAAHTALTYSFSVTRFYELKASGTDGKAFEQLLYNITNGEGISSTIAPPHILQSWLGIHFSPVLYVVTPIYYLFPHIEILLFIHSFFIALAAIPLFFAAQIIFKSQLQALAISIFYLINPFVVNAGLWDFHEIAFAPFLISLMLWAIVKKNKILLVMFCLLLLCVKEHYGLAVFGSGLLWAWHWREPKFGLTIAVTGLTAFIIIIKIIMPYFSPIGAAAMIGEGSAIDRFSWLYHPLDDMQLLGKRISDAIFYIILLLFAFLALPLFSFVWLFPAAADGIINMLANEDMMRHPSSYHSAAIIPVLLIAYSQTIAWKYNTYTNIKRREILAATAVMVLAFSYNFIALPFFPNNTWELSGPRFSLSEKDKNADNEIVKIIGENTSISAQSNILPHIPVRREMYMFPNGIEKSEYIILNTSNPFTGKSNVFGLPYFSRYTDMYFSAFYELLDDKNFGVVFYQDNWLLFKRGAENRQDVVEQVKEDVYKLQEKIEALDKRKIVIQPSHPQ